VKILLHLVVFLDFFFILVNLGVSKFIISHSFLVLVFCFLFLIHNLKWVVLV